MEQLQLDFTGISLHKENNSQSEEILIANELRLNNNCKILYDAMMRGEILTSDTCIYKYKMKEYRRRFADLKAAGVPVKDAIIKNGGGCKKWWIER